jgi:hypothetical protein
MRSRWNKFQKGGEVVEWEGPKVVLRYPMSAVLFAEIQAWERLGFAARQKGENVIEISEANKQESLNNFFTPNFIKTFEEAGVKIKLSWK